MRLMRINTIIPKTSDLLMIHRFIRLQAIMIETDNQADSNIFHVRKDTCFICLKNYLLFKNSQPCIRFTVEW